MPLSYVIVGSGYRAMYYGRIAAAYPSLFRALFLCRSQEKAVLMKQQTGVDATVSLEKALAFQPDFAVIAVDHTHIAEVAMEWAQRGIPVAAETPIGASMDQLTALWRLHQQTSAKIVCLEQYHRHPVLSAGLSAVAQGRIGTPTTAYLSLVHDYHAASLIRRMLLTNSESYTLRGMRTVTPATATDSRYGAILDGSTANESRDLVHIAFASGKTAVYDFASLQYRTFIRSRHLTVRGTSGEWNDTQLYTMNEDHMPERTLLMAELPRKYRALDTQALRDLRKTWQHELFLDTQHDEYAIATMLLDMGEYIAGGNSPYPLQEALDDAYFLLLLQEAVAHPWQEVTSGPVPWRT